jgi:hypothetical protein
LRLVIGVLHEALAVSTEKQLENDAYIAYTVNASAAGSIFWCEGNVDYDYTGQVKRLRA